MKERRFHIVTSKKVVGETAQGVKKNRRRSKENKTEGAEAGKERENREKSEKM